MVRYLGFTPYIDLSTVIFNHGISCSSYLIDFEDSQVISDDEDYGVWADWEWPVWGLRTTDDDDREDEKRGYRRNRDVSPLSWRLIN